MGDESGTPQFSRAEYQEPSSATLPSVPLAAPDPLADNHGLFLRGLAFGAGGALIGLILYATVGIITGLVIGYMALGVGYIVGKAVLMGSRGRTGRRYQVAATLLTYAAVSMAAIPVALWQIAHAPATTLAETSHVTDVSTSSAPSTASGPATNGPASNGPATIDAGTHQDVSLLGAIGGLTMLGLASPFLDLQDPVHGLIGLVILFVGLRIAWKMTGSR